MTRKLSQISSASFPLAGGDRLVGVSAANVDLLYPNIFTDFVSVADFGALPAPSVGTVTDCTAAIQACFDYVWGPSGSPRGNSGPLAAIYFPHGYYGISSPLYITNATGGFIWSSMGAALIWMSGSSFVGNTLPGGADNTITPILAVNGFNGVRVVNIEFAMGTNLANSQNNCCGLYGYGQFSSSGCIFDNCNFQGATIGAYLGVGSPSNVSEWKFYNCGFLHNGTAGVWIQGGNSLNFSFMKCGGFNNGNDPMAAFGDNYGWLVVTTGGIVSIIDADPSQNARDIKIGQNRTFIQGVRTESPSFLSVESGAFAHLSGCQQTANGGTYTGSTSGTMLTITGITTPSNTGIVKGQQVVGTQGGNSLPKNNADTVIVKQLNGTPGGIGTYQLSAAGAPSDLGSTTITVLQVFLRLNGQGQALLDNSGGGAWMSASNGLVSVRGNVITNAFIASILTGFSGQIFGYDTMADGQQIVSQLPAASASFKGVRMAVTDSSVALTSSTNIGAIVAGGGSNTVPVWCDGTNWRIG